MLCVVAAFNEIISASGNSAAPKLNKKDRVKHFSIGDADDIHAVQPVIAQPRDKGGGVKHVSVGRHNKLRKALSKFSFLPSKTSTKYVYSL